MKLIFKPLLLLLCLFSSLAAMPQNAAFVINTTNDERTYENLVIDMVATGNTIPGNSTATAGITIEPGAINVTIRNCTIKNLSGNRFGILFKVTTNGTQSSNITIDNVRIEGAVGNKEGAGISVKSAKTVNIKGCTIKTLKNGIDLPMNSTAEATNAVTIDGCTITSMGENGIHATQMGTRNNISSTNPSGILANHNNLVIKNCNISDISTSYIGANKGLYHGIYSQAAGVIIENNTVFDCYDGLGISQRSNGTIKRNRVFRCKGSGIGYFGDHMYDVNDPKLWIFNNVVFSTNQNVSLMSVQPCFNPECLDSRAKGKTLEEVYVGFNTVVYKNATTTLASGAFLINISGTMTNGDTQDKLVKVYGNLLVNRNADSKYIGSPNYPYGTTAEYDYLVGNLRTTSNVGFQDFDGDDYHLVTGSKAICWAKDVTIIPANDKDLKARDATKDAGAYDWTGTTCPTTTARISSMEAEAGEGELANTRLSLYPNPATSKLTLSYTSQADEPVNISVSSQVSGRFLHRTEWVKAGPNTILLDISNLSAGIYFLKVDGGNGQTVQKFVVLR